MTVHGRASTHHGAEGPTPGYYPDRSLGHPVGHYGRLFDIPGLTATREALAALARHMRDENAEQATTNGWDGSPPAQPDPNDNADIPADYTYVGQFIDHDLTFDATSSAEKRNKVLNLANARAPALDLDSVYGAGPEIHPHLYDERGFLVARKKKAGDEVGFDLQRAGIPNVGAPARSRATAIIGDPRNDENRIV